MTNRSADRAATTVGLNTGNLVVDGTDVQPIDDISVQNVIDGPVLPPNSFNAEGQALEGDESSSLRYSQSLDFSAYWLENNAQNSWRCDEYTDSAPAAYSPYVGDSLLDVTRHQRFGFQQALQSSADSIFTPNTTEIEDHRLNTDIFSTMGTDRQPRMLSPPLNFSNHQEEIEIRNPSAIVDTSNFGISISDKLCIDGPAMTMINDQPSYNHQNPDGVGFFFPFNPFHVGPFVGIPHNQLFDNQGVYEKLAGSILPTSCFDTESCTPSMNMCVALSTTEQTQKLQPWIRPNHNRHRDASIHATGGASEKQQNLEPGKPAQPSQYDWFTNRNAIENLYRSHDLKHVMAEMKRCHGFHARLVFILYRSA